MEIPGLDDSERRTTLSEVAKNMLKRSVIFAVIALTTRVAWAAPTSITACRNITIPGSYQLANNLQATGNCLLLQSSDVTIDLNGFSIGGNQTGAGITDGGTKRLRIIVRNGTIQLFQTAIDLAHSQIVTIQKTNITNNVNGIMAGDYSGVDTCFVGSNIQGIRLGSSCTATNNRLSKNRDVVISTGNNCIVAGNNGSDNSKALGIRGGTAALVIGNVASSDYAGINVGDGSTVADNTVSDDPLFGIIVNRGSTVARNTATLNGTGANGEGIQVHENSLIWGNTSSQNKFGFTIYCPTLVLGNTSLFNSSSPPFYFANDLACESVNNLPPP